MGSRRGRRGQVGGQVAMSERAVLPWSLVDMRVQPRHWRMAEAPAAELRGHPGKASSQRERRQVPAAPLAVGRARDQSAAHSRDEIKDAPLELALCIGAGAAEP